jgi:hypothetical protein
MPQLVAPTTRRDPGPRLADVRRVEKWDRLVIEEGPYGLPLLGALDGLISVAPHLDDGAFHVLLQQLVFAGQVDLTELMARRRTGLPGSARITRVGELYRLGLDSPQEVKVFNIFRFHGQAPDHLNASVLMPWGLVGPFDGLDDIGSAYEVDGADHTDDRHLVTDPWKDERASRARLELVRLTNPDIDARAPAVDGWVATRSRAALIVRESPLQVIHQRGRWCPCGHRP